jgi:adiponectin receptor
MYCQMAVATIYLTFSVTAGIVCFLVCLFEWIHKLGNEKYRSLLFGTFGLSMLVPLSHLVINDVVYNNYGDPFSFTSSITYYVLLAFSYMLGLYIYTVRCPERNNPGKYNICGHSHQIFHVLVVLGIVFTYLGALESFEMRKHSQCPV